MKKINARVKALRPEDIVYSETEKQQILKDAITVYGANSQRLMLFEEMAELQDAICKYERKRGADNEQIPEEIADVLIMLGQMMIIYDCEESVRNYINFKLRRLNNRTKQHTDDFSDLPFC